MSRPFHSGIRRGRTYSSSIRDQLNLKEGTELEMVVIDYRRQPLFETMIHPNNESLPINSKSIGMFTSEYGSYSNKENVKYLIEDPQLPFDLRSNGPQEKYMDSTEGLDNSNMFFNTLKWILRTGKNSKSLSRISFSTKTHYPNS